MATKAEICCTNRVAGRPSPWGPLMFDFDRYSKLTSLILPIRQYCQFVRHCGVLFLIGYGFGLRHLEQACHANTGLPVPVSIGVDMADYVVLKQLGYTAGYIVH